MPFERANFVLSVVAILIATDGKRRGVYHTSRKMLWGTSLGDLSPHRVSMMPGGAHEDSELTSLENEDSKDVRNSRRGNEDSAHLGQLVHGHYPTGHRVYEGLARSFGGLMLVVFPRSLFASPRVLFSVVQHTSSSYVSTGNANNTWRYVALFSGVTWIIRRADWDNIAIESL